MDTNIKEYVEEMTVEIEKRIYRVNKRWVVVAYNEGGYNQTAVDLVELLAYVKENIPEIWPKP